MIRNVRIETEDGVMNIVVDVDPDTYTISVSRELVETASLRELSMVIGRALRAVWAGANDPLS
jgi:hypothetical protein